MIEKRDAYFDCPECEGEVETLEREEYDTETGLAIKFGRYQCKKCGRNTEFGSVKVHQGFSGLMDILNGNEKKTGP